MSHSSKADTIFFFISVEKPSVANSEIMFSIKHQIQSHWLPDRLWKIQFARKIDFVLNFSNKFRQTQLIKWLESDFFLPVPPSPDRSRFTIKLEIWIVTFEKSNRAPIEPKTNILTQVAFTLFRFCFDTANHFIGGHRLKCSFLSTVRISAIICLARANENQIELHFNPQSFAFD